MKKLWYKYKYNQALKRDLKLRKRIKDIEENQFECTHSSLEWQNVQLLINTNKEKIKKYKNVVSK